MKNLILAFQKIYTMQQVSSFSTTRLIALAIFSCLFFTAKAQREVLYYKNAPDGFASAKIPKALLLKDMQYWQKVMEESHVNLYHAISKEALQQLQEDIIKELPDSVTHFQASFAISRLIGSLNEGHLGFASDRVSDSLYAYQCVRFPYLIQEINNGALIVQRDLSSGNKLPPLSRIIEINNNPVEQLYKKYASFNGGLEPWRKLMVKNNIRKLLYMDGIVSPFTIKAIVNNDTIQFITDGYTRQQADSISKVLSAATTPFLPFSLQFTDNNIALIGFNTMSGSLRDSFSVFLRRSFEEIQLRNAAGVIIDLRKNGGGDSGLGDTLISYISGKPYRNTAGMKMRISQHSKALTELRGTDDPFKKWKNGKIYEYKVKTLTKPTDNRLRFKGRVAVLIGTGTFSSANMLANAIKDYQLAILIGESTAEPGNDFGEIFSFMLPNTYIVATGAIKMFTRANGEENDFEGIKPDIEIKNSPADILLKKDSVIDKAAEWILNAKN
ncbi:MAG: hypothetical protein JNN00_02960 [Chitinophagaceae bacterium]|nr:hypothetical protein [Chitinophagaceae bacterium]